MNLGHRKRAAIRRTHTVLLTLALAALPVTSQVMAQDSGTPNSNAVFDAPGQPGVRMMSPIPDKPDTPAPAAKPAPKQKAKPKASPPPKAVNARANGSKVNQAFAAAGGDWNRARLLAAESGNPVARLIVEWRYLLDESSGANFEAINAFLNEHPNWPRLDALSIRAEKTMPEDYPPSRVIAWYAKHPPRSGTGFIRLGTAMMDMGQRDEGMAQIRKGWTQYNFSPFDENQISTTYSNVLGPAEHKARLLRLLANEDLGGAKRQMLRVDAQTQRLGNALLRIKASPAIAKTVLDSFTDSARDPDLLFEASRALRRRGFDEDAWALMLKTPENKADLVAPERWSVERQIMARDALKRSNYELAYRLAANPSLDAESGAAFMDAEFLAGWIALRYQHRPEIAYRHFDRLAKGVTYPISVARAHYWLGRTNDAMNRSAEALAEYRKAADYGATFYGQLAQARFGDSPLLRVKAAVSDPLPSERSAFETDDRVRAVRLLSELGDRGTARQFALAIATDPPDPKKLEMLAQLMASLGDPAMSVRVAKNASYSEIYLLSYLHPVMTVPKYSGDAPEAALVLGLARQESEFDSGAVSSAGARGLMQLMPASAKRAASARGLAYRPNDLGNPSYNMQLGMATISEYLDRWDGSYILAIASYNAGPGNVRNWVDAFGDPRDAGVDPIDWIEAIPYPETRNYVQRVLENLEVYRNRLSNSDQKLEIVSDLYRASNASYAARTGTGIPAVTAIEGATAVIPSTAAAVGATPAQ